MAIDFAFSFLMIIDSREQVTGREFTGEKYEIKIEIIIRASYFGSRTLKPHR